MWMTVQSLRPPSQRTTSAAPRSVSPQFDEPSMKSSTGGRATAASALSIATSAARSSFWLLQNNIPVSSDIVKQRRAGRPCCTAQRPLRDSHHLPTPSRAFPNDPEASHVHPSASTVRGL